MAETNTSIGFSGLLAILFIGLKLTGVISWSWVWILCPLWIPLALFFVFFAIICTLVLIGALLQ